MHLRPSRRGSQQSARVLGCVVSVLALGIVSPGELCAQPSSQRAMAESLFQEGRALMDAGDVASACPRFAESVRLELALGTLLNLGACYEALGKTASAWAEFSRALALAERAGDAERAAWAESRISALGPRLSRVVLEVKDEPRGLRIAIDGEEIQAGAWGSPLPLDPGVHQVHVSAPDRVPWASNVSLDPGPTELRVSVPALLRAKVVETPEVEVTPRPTVGGDLASATAAPDPDRTWLWTSLGVAVAGIAVGSLASVDYFEQRELLDVHCDGEYCDPQGMAADERARSSALVADVAFGVGILAGIVSGYLWYSEPNERSTGVRLRASGVAGGLGLGAEARY